MKKITRVALAVLIVLVAAVAAARRLNQAPTEEKNNDGD